MKASISSGGQDEGLGAESVTEELALAMALPSGVRGPVENLELAWLMSARARGRSGLRSPP